MKKPAFIEALGLSDTDITALKADTTGKTFSQLLTEKGFTKDTLKAKELEVITKNFNADFDKRYEEMKDKKVSEMFGPKEGMNQKGGRGEKMHGGMKLTDEELAKKLGITVDELKKARDAGTLKDLMDKKRDEMKAQMQTTAPKN